MTTYNVTVTREGRWWMVHIPDLDGLTQARNLAEAPLMAREYIAVTLNVPIEEVDVAMHYDTIGNVRDVNARLAAIAKEREQARELERRATAEATALARALVDDHVPLRDVGVVLGVSHQRAHQLVNAGG